MTDAEMTAALARRRGWMIRAALAFLPDPDRALEAVQIASLSAWQHRATEVRDVDAWLVRLAQNAARRIAREDWTLPLFERDGSERDNGYGHADAALDARSLLDARLPGTSWARHRRAVELRFGLVDGVCWTQAEIALDLGVSQQYAGRLIHRALDRLRLVA